MILRFVAGTGIISRAIIAQEKTALPLTPSHVEVLSEDGSPVSAVTRLAPPSYTAVGTAHVSEVTVATHEIIPKGA